MEVLELFNCLCSMFVFYVKISEDDLQKIETCGVIKLCVKMYMNTCAFVVL